MGGACGLGDARTRPKVFIGFATLLTMGTPQPAQTQRPPACMVHPPGSQNIHPHKGIHFRPVSTSSRRRDADWQASTAVDTTAIPATSTDPAAITSDGAQSSSIPGAYAMRSKNSVAPTAAVESVNETSDRDSVCRQVMCQRGGDHTMGNAAGTHLRCNHADPPPRIELAWCTHHRANPFLPHQARPG